LAEEKKERMNIQRHTTRMQAKQFTSLFLSPATTAPFESYASNFCKE